MGVFSVLVALCCTVCFFTSPANSQQQTANSCGDPEAFTRMILEGVLQHFKEGAYAIEEALKMAKETHIAAKEALAQCYNEYESTKSLKQARLAYAGKMAKQVERLQTQKDASKRELDRAQQLLNAAKSPHASSQQHAAAARQRANEALLVARERSRAAALAWAEANAAQQQSTNQWPQGTANGQSTNQWPQGTANGQSTNQWPQGTANGQSTNQWVQGTTNVKGSLTVGVPHGHQTGTYSPQPLPADRKVRPIQTQGSAGASKLAEVAKAAEYAAAVAESEAKRLNEIASAAERSVMTDWNNMSPSYRSFTHTQRNYQAICESYAQQKAAYDAAILGIGAAETLILQKKEAIEHAKANLGAELANLPIVEAQVEAAYVVVKYVQDLIDKLSGASTGTSSTSTTTPTAPTSATPNNPAYAPNTPLAELIRRLTAGNQGRSNTASRNIFNPAAFNALRRMTAGNQGRSNTASRNIFNPAPLNALRRTTGLRARNTGGINAQQIRNAMQSLRSRQVIRRTAPRRNSSRR